MKIIKTEIIILNIPMVKSLEVSFGSIKNLKPIIIKLTDELGNIGYGESMLLPFPMTHFEYFETGLLTLEKIIVPSILNKEILLDENNYFNTIDDFIGLYNNVKNFEMSKVGVENAFVHLLTQRINKNIYQMFEVEKKEIETIYGFSIPTNLDNYLNNVRDAISLGCKSLKLKICKGNDIELIKLVRSNFPNVKISIDANQDYTFEEFKKIISFIDDNNIEQVEQPFKYDDYISNIKVRKIMKTKLCLDESICSIDQLENMIDNMGIDILNIKIGRVGGVYSAYKMNKLCEENNIGTWVGSLLETDLGMSYNLAIAGMNNCIYSNAYIVWNRYYTDFIGKSPLGIVDGKVKINLNSKGIGFEIDNSKIKKYEINRIIIK